MNRKPIFLFIFNLLCAAIISLAQDTLYYKGDLNVAQGQSMPLTLRIVQTKDTTILYMGSPAQTEQLFAATKTKFTNDSVKFNISNMGIKTRLAYSEGKQILKGTFKQGLLNTEITFYRTESLFTFARPQTPKPPFNYNEKELTFKNPNSEYTFHGMLTYPKDNKKYPLVVLVSGSGCQNRDEEIYKHKPFMVIADYLTKNGIAVFRYDDRGFGSTDTNMYKGTTYDFSMDTRHAIEMLKKEEMIDKNNIFVLGHSEGGMICQILGAQYSDLKGLILMAAPFVSGKDILISQTEAIMRLNGATESEITEALQEINSAKYDTNTLNGLWLDYFYKFEPAKYLKKLKLPLLILQGGKDMQVLAEINLSAMEKNLPKSSKTKEVKLYPELNHLFQTCKTGNPDEYSQIEQTIAPQVLEDIKVFVLKTAEN
ncbi:MAG: alpha/beta fold hydrolase [Bacteroidales bacterium]|nr:alpha/beta fold hydrolase [Bacteroidales bacterium]